MLLELSNVRKTYPGHDGAVHALADVSLALEAGEFLAVRGPSGCGKTTLLLVAGALLKPDQGRVEVAGTNPYELAADRRARFRAETIGFVFQQFHLVPYLSVLDNVLAPAVASGTNGAVDRARELIGRFNLEHRLHHVPSQLSTGERQRTALARALLNRPKLLLADEPTGNLDRENADVVLGFLKDFAVDGGGVLLVTHDEHAADFAGRTLHLSEGRVATTADAAIQSEAAT